MTQVRANFASRLRSVGRLICVLALTAGLGSCGDLPKILNAGQDAIQQASDQIDVAESDLNVASSNWQQVLQQLLNNLNSDAKSLIGNDIQNLINKTVATTGSEFRCDADFVNHRVGEDLLAIKAKLLKQPIPVLAPAFCQAVPVAVDRAQVPSDVTYLTFYGYNFDPKADLHVKLQAADGSETEVDKSVIAIPTSYSMTVNLTNVPMTTNSRNLELYYGDQLLSSVGIIQAQTPVKICQGSQTEVDGPVIGPFIPPKFNYKADDDFDGNGPNINISVSLITTPKTVVARVYMDARETKKDWTEVQGTKDFVVYQAPPNQQIASVVNPGSTNYNYLDTGYTRSHDFFAVDLGAGVARHMEIVGDTSGNDVGKTQVSKIILNPLQISLTEVGDCTSPFALKSLMGTKFLSAPVKSLIATNGLLESKIAVHKLAAPIAPGH